MKKPQYWRREEESASALNFSSLCRRTSYMSFEFQLHYRIFNSPHACLPQVSHSHLHFWYCTDTLIKTVSQCLSYQVFHPVDGHPRRCRNQSCGFLYAVFLTTAPASCQQRFNCSTAAPCSWQSPAQAPFIVPSIINEEWKAPGEQAWRCRQYQSPQKCKLCLWQWGQMYFNFSEPKFRAALPPKLSS